MLYKRHSISEKVDVRELLQKTGIKLYNKRVLDTEQPLNNILPEKKSVGYNLRKENFLYPDVNTIRFKNTYVNTLIFKYDIRFCRNMCNFESFSLFCAP